MTDAVDTKHPDYIARADQWRLMRDTTGGEGDVKGAGEENLPQPSGFKAQPDGGRALYAAYQKRAQFPEIVHPTVHGMVGVIHRTEAQIEIPTAMEPLWEKATKDGQPLEALHRRVTAELLTTGRYACLLTRRAKAAICHGSPVYRRGVDQLVRRSLYVRPARKRPQT